MIRALIAFACRVRINGKVLAHLAQCDWFYDGHRAEHDVLAALYLLAHEAENGETMLTKLIDCAEKPTWRIHAVNSPFDSQDQQKAQGCRWDTALRSWWREVAHAELEVECA